MSAGIHVVTVDDKRVYRGLDAELARQAWVGAQVKAEANKETCEIVWSENGKTLPDGAVYIVDGEDETDLYTGYVS